MDTKPTYDELKAKCDDFQAQIIRFLKVEQDLVDARSKLDRDLSLLRSIQTYSQRVLSAVSIEEFADTTVESVVETFEVECSAFFLFDKEKDEINIISYFGFEEEIHDSCRLNNEWISEKGFMKNGKVIIENVEPDSESFGTAGLYKVIISPYYDEDDLFHGVVIGGVSNAKKAYYDEITEQLIPSFMVFTQQMSAMLKNFEAKRSLDSKVKERTEQVVKQKEELQKMLENLKQAQSQLVQSEKMASLGQLVAGIAHEINNPVNFISAGVESLSMNLEEIGKVLEIYNRITIGNVREKLLEINELKKDIEYKEAIREINKLIESIKNGVIRTTEIVRGLRTFSRLDEDVLKEADIHEGIDSTLILLHNKYKNRIEIVRKYGKIPLIECFPGQINQVFMNILSNAVDAIEGNGEIVIITSLSGNNVRISIRDSGNGIPEDLRKKIFDPFFTTKGVGKGTGLGLSITRSIIEKHNGSVRVLSETGKGSEFLITLPVKQ